MATKKTSVFFLLLMSTIVIAMAKKLSREHKDRNNYGTSQKRSNDALENQDGPFPRSFQQVRKVIYHQTMTPTWLKKHAAFIYSSHSASAQQLTFNADAVAHAALLKVTMIRAGVLNDPTPLTVEITVSNNISFGGHLNGYVDSDINYGVSDGHRFIGFQTMDKGNYVDHSPCFETEGVSGQKLTSIRYGPKSSQLVTESVYPGQFVISLKLDEDWGSCYTALDGGFVRTAVYNNRLMLNNGLSLEVYKTDAGESVGIKFIKVSIILDEA